MWNLLLGLLSFWMSFCVTPRKIVHFLEAAAKTDRNNLSFVSPETVKAACVQLTPCHYKNLNAFLSHMLMLTRTAVDSGAQLVVFPAYTGLFAATMVPLSGRILRWATGGTLADIGKLNLRVNPRRVTRLVGYFHNFIYEIYMHTFSTLARLQGVYIVAGTSLFYERGKLYNRCVVFGPDGAPVGEQDKTSSLGFDRSIGVSAGSEIEVISTPMGKLAVVIGSDAHYFENFLIAKALGVQIFAAPVFKSGILPDLLRCRADESDGYILFAPLVGEQKNERASIFAPSYCTADAGGVLCRAENDASSVLLSRLNLQKLGVSLIGSEPNTAFLTGDYLHSYRYAKQIGGSAEQTPPPVRTQRS